MIERKYVDLYAAASGVTRDVAEKDIVLTYILKMMGDDDILEKLAFKGGTCIRKVYLGKTGRFSEDLDFTLPGGDLEGIRRDFERFIAGGVRYGFSLFATNYRGDWKKSFACYIGYKHEWCTEPGSVKFEVSLREEPVLKVSAKKVSPDLYFKYADFEPFEIPCMEREEVLAEKIRAAYMRTTTRDIYDLYQFAGRAYNKEVVRNLVVIKLWNEEHEYDPETLLEKIDGSRINFEDIEFLLSKGEHPSERKIKHEILENYSYLKEIDSDAKKIIKDVKKHKEKELVKKLMKKVIDDFS